LKNRARFLAALGMTQPVGFFNDLVV